MPKKKGSGVASFNLNDESEDKPNGLEKTKSAAEETETEKENDSRSIHTRESATDVAAADGGERISIKISKDGVIDMGGMREATQNKVKKILANSKNIEIATGNPIQRFDADFCRGILDNWSELKTAIASTKIPADAAKVIFTYQPEAREKLSQSLGPVLDKYCPDTIGNHKELINFAMLFIMIERNQWMAVKELAKVPRNKISVENNQIHVAMETEKVH